MAKNIIDLTIEERKKLQEIKKELGLENVNDVIKFLIKKYLLKNETKQ